MGEWLLVSCLQCVCFCLVCLSICLPVCCSVWLLLFWQLFLFWCSSVCLFFLGSAMLFRFYPRILWLEKMAWSIFCFPLSSLLDSTGGLCDLHGQQTVCRRKEGSSAQRDSVASAGSSFWSLPLSGIFKYSTIWWIILLTVNQILHAQLS